MNHWLAGSQLESLFKHLQVLVTMLLLESTSRQTGEPSVSFDERCILESDVMSHLELGPVHIIPSFAGFPILIACKQKYVPLIVKIFWGV